MEGTTQDDIAPKKSNGRRKLLGMAILLAAIAAGIWYYLDSRLYESTDNAFLDGDIIQVSSRVAGQVLRVEVVENQRVNRGDLLAEIDPSDFEVRLAEAKAKLADSQAKVAAAQSTLALTSSVTSAVLVQAGAGYDAAREQVEVLSSRLAQDAANIQAAEAALQMAEARRTAAEAEAGRAASDASRYRALIAKDEISKQTLDRAETDARSSAANLDAARQAVAGATAQLAQAKAARTSTLATIRQMEKQVQQAEGRFTEAKSAPLQVRVRESDIQVVRAQIEQQQAAVRQAELSLSYTRITAPESGFVTRKSVQPGNFAGVGQIMMAIVSDRLVGSCEFQGDSAHAHAAGSGGRHPGGCLSAVKTAGQGGEHSERLGIAVQPDASGKRHRQLREGGAACARQDSAYGGDPRRIPRRAGDVRGS